MEVHVMRDLLGRIFDLGTIPRDATDLHLTFEHPLPDGAWFLVIIGSLSLAAWCYWGLLESNWKRLLLFSLRTSTLVLVVFLISGPQITFPRESVESDLVIAMVDRSSSLNIRDVPTIEGRITRDDQLMSLIDDEAKTWNDLSDRSELLWYGFSSSPFSLPFDEGIEQGETITSLMDPPDGWRTNINGSMETLLDSVSGRSLSGIILFSDGRTTSILDRGLLRRLQTNSIPVFTVPLGSPSSVNDIGIIDIDHPENAFIKDSVPIVVTLGLTGGDSGSEIVIRLRDDQTDTVLDERSVVIDPDDPRVLLTATLDEPGIRKLKVELAAGDDDLISENNQRFIKIDVIDRPIRILYVEGYPRWEYRYLKNLLIREESIESSIMLLSADMEFAQEGDLALERLPRSREEMNRFDLIIIGDVPAGFFTDEQLELVSESVSSEGTGLLWIGGRRSNPSTWNQSSLDDLLPFTPPFDLQNITGGVLVEPTETASELGLFIVDPQTDDGWIPDLSRRSTGWSLLRSVQRIASSQLKPTTEVLANVIDQDDSSHPGVMMMRFGAGQVIYSSFDDIWRWRFGRGEELTDRWWLGILRLMARQSIDSSGRIGEISLDSPIPSPGTPTTMRLAVFDESVSRRIQDLVVVSVRDLDGGEISEVELIRENDGSEWSSEWTPRDEGEFELVFSSSETSRLFQDGMKSSIMVRMPEAEYRNLDTDHGLLELISRETGGSVLNPDSMNLLPDALPNRDVLIENPIRVSIWNSGFFFLVLILLLGFEWALRRMVRMT
ncbi:MAG: hypothetical protein CMJ40_02860 [Phycisphaerae bacterium]|nr:hypothetical protein [Phycisphaerae bacterium]